MNNTLRPLRPERGIVTPLRPHTTLGPVSPASAASISETLGRRQTCLQCRVRKVKCDGRGATCQNCERLKFDCSFQHSPHGATGHYTQRLPERRRRMQACRPCRIRKIKCPGEEGVCSNCAKKGLECSYPEPKRKTNATTPESDKSYQGSQPTEFSMDESHSEAVDIGGPPAEVQLDLDTLLGLVEDYFRHLYPLPSYAFLHKATVMQRCQDGAIDKPLKLAICAITSLHLQHSSFCHDIWAQRAEQLLLQRLAYPSIFSLQALLLVIRYRIEIGEFSTAFMLASLAARSAVALRLNYERPELSSTAQEARRRLFWSLFLLDDFFCVGLREFELCPQDIIHLQLPHHEEFFQMGESAENTILQQNNPHVSDQMGIFAVFLRLVARRREVMRFIRRVGLRELEPSKISDSLQWFDEKLQSLRAGLSPSEQYSVWNMTSCGQQAQFIMLHVSWHQCFCDLYRLFLDGYTEAAPSPLLASINPRNRHAMQQKCVEHAEAILQIVSDFWSYGSRDILLERDVAVCAFESARIVLFISSTAANSTSMDTALRKAQLCLDMITHFFSRSASVKSLRNNLMRLISSYSARLALQHKEPLREPDNDGRRTSPRVSQYANARQKLSVQSLLLQSDFVDDSDEIAVAPSMTSASASPVASMNLDPPATNEDRVPASGIGDDGFAFNPWMGFPGKDDVYSLYEFSEDPNEHF